MLDASTARDADRCDDSAESKRRDEASNVCGHEATQRGFGRRCRERLGRLRRDERAIEGLPVRLVIALVVGVASLGVMLSLIEGVGTVGATEVDAKLDPSVTTPGEQTVSVQVVGSDGDPVAGATVVVSGDTADVASVATARTDRNGTAEVQLTATLPPNRMEGTLEISIKPPAAGQYVDRRGNTRLLVIREN